MKAEIKAARKYFGLGSKYYWFVLVGNNGEIIATSEQYTQKHNAVEILQKHFTGITVIDYSLK